MRAPLYESGPFQGCAALVGCPGLGHTREPGTQVRPAPRLQKSNRLAKTILTLTCFSNKLLVLKLQRLSNL